MSSHCSCGTSYIGEMGWSINQMIKEHVVAIKHGRTKSWALAEHVVKTKHHICIVEVKLFAKISHFDRCKFREAIGIDRSSNNVNRDDDLKSSSYWISALSSYSFPSFSELFIPFYFIEDSPSLIIYFYCFFVILCICDQFHFLFFLNWSTSIFIQTVTARLASKFQAMR